MKLYAGIGSREAPPWALELAERIADRLRAEGWTLRSGHAEGTDEAFEGAAAEDAEVYLPWPSFRGDPIQARTIIDQPFHEAAEVARRFHPNWAACNAQARRLHARNAHIILGADLISPAKFAVCWYVKPGGTSLAVEIARAHGVPVFNFAEPPMRERLERWALAVAL